MSFRFRFGSVRFGSVSATFVVSVSDSAEPKNSGFVRALIMIVARASRSILNECKVNRVEVNFLRML